MLSIEYIGEEFAVCIDDNGDKVKVPRSSLPDAVAVNDVITKVSGGSYGVDKSETGLRKNRNRAMLERIDAVSRRDSIAEVLSGSKIPISASVLAEKFGVKLLAKIPIDPVICQGGDAGTPFIQAFAKTVPGRIFAEMADKLFE